MKTKKYDEFIKKHEVKPKFFKNMLIAFAFGGLVCLFGQLLIEVYVRFFGYVRETAGTLMIVSVILITSILTGIGVYDKFGQVAKAGAFIPISGFANSLTAAALEGKSEGIVLGIATNLFKLAGAVIVFAIVSAYVFGMIRFFLVKHDLVPGLEHVALYLLK